MSWFSRWNCIFTLTRVWMQKMALGRATCPRPRKDVEDSCESYRHSWCLSYFTSALPKCSVELGGMHFLKVVKGTGSRSPSGSSEIMFKNVRPGCGITFLWTRSRAMVALRITDEIAGLSEFETCNRRFKFCQDREGSVARAPGRQYGVDTFMLSRGYLYLHSLGMTRRITGLRQSCWCQHAISGCCSHYGDAPSNITVWRNSLWPYLVDSSDRDPKRRPALYLHCMNREITPVDPLHRYVGSLRGMNLYTG